MRAMGNDTKRLVIVEFPKDSNSVVTRGRVSMVLVGVFNPHPRTYRPIGNVGKAQKKSLPSENDVFRHARREGWL